MRVELAREYRFESAHRLPRLPEGHRCTRLHGHSFRLEIVLAGEVAEDGFLIDFYDVDQRVAPLIDALDHRYLNEIEGLENPTSEILARWIWQRLKPALPVLTSVTIAETCDARCTYRGA